MTPDQLREWNATRPFPHPNEAQEIIFEGHRCVVMDPECYEECFKQAESHAAALEEIERLKAERDAAFAMSKCECESNECCANLVKAQERADIDAHQLAVMTEMAGANHAAWKRAERMAERLEGFLCAIFNNLDTYPPHAPGHCHSTPGIWDADNDSAIAGKRCEWCAKWSEIRGTLRADKGE